jgi:hypothetical protein
MRHLRSLNKNPAQEGAMILGCFSVFSMASLPANFLRRHGNLGFFEAKEPEVKDSDLYAAPLHLSHPWRVTEVKLDIAASRIDVWIEHAPDTKWLCPECRKVANL